MAHIRRKFVDVHRAQGSSIADDPHAWLADTLARIPDYKITRVDELLPWRTRQ